MRPLPPPGTGSGSGAGVPGAQSCAQLRAQIRNLVSTLANLQASLAHTTDPTRRADLERGIQIASEELSALQRQVPLVCAPPPPRRQTIHALVLADGDFSLAPVPDPTDSVFTLSHFVSALRSETNPLWAFAVTLAHREKDPGANGVAASGVFEHAYLTWQSSAAPAGRSAVDLAAFDVAFLFGHDGYDESAATEWLAWDGGAGEAQLWAIAQFMQHGGGVFATGDHESLGAAMCAAIPRVRSMRRWLFAAGDTPGAEPETAGPRYGASFASGAQLTHPRNRAPYADLGMRCAPPALGPLRYDTLRGRDETVLDPLAGRNESGIPFDRQSDDVPQPITAAAHPIFALAGGARLAVLPDHMHEGKCIDLSDFDAGHDPRRLTYTHEGQTLAEYPASASAGQPLPELLATETTVPGHASPTGEIEHIGALDAVVAASFAGVSAYDGSRVGVGRIVVHSTWHHFLDINVIGDPASDVPDDARRRGFTTAVGRPHLAQFERYWANLGIWLASRTHGAALLLAAVDHARRRTVVRMAANPAASSHGEAVHDLGAVVTRIVDRHLPAPLLRDAVGHALPAPNAEGVTRWLATARAGRPEAADAADRTFLHGFMGGAVMHAMGYPDDHVLLTDMAAAGPAVTAAGMRGAARALAVSRQRAAAAELIALLADR